MPQGSVLGPVLFDIFIDDIDDCAELITLLLKFADDTKGMQEIGGPGDRDKLQQAMDKMIEWAKTRGMKFNIPKCKVMHIGRNNPRYEYKMAGEKQCFGSGSGLDPDSIGSLDPDPDWESGSGSRGKKSSKNKNKKLYFFLH